MEEISKVQRWECLWIPMQLYQLSERNSRVVKETRESWIDIFSNRFSCGISFGIALNWLEQFCVQSVFGCSTSFALRKSMNGHADHTKMFVPFDLPWKWSLSYEWWQVCTVRNIIQHKYWRNTIWCCTFKINQINKCSTFSCSFSISISFIWGTQTQTHTHTHAHTPHTPHTKLEFGIWPINEYFLDICFSNENDINNICEYIYEYGHSCY